MEREFSLGPLFFEVGWASLKVYYETVMVAIFLSQKSENALFSLMKTLYKIINIGALNSGYNYVISGRFLTKID